MKGKAKKKAIVGEAKKKTIFGEASEPVVAEAKVGLPRSVYTLEESIGLTKCWADISEDPIIANNQEIDGFQGRITERYKRVKPAWPPTHKPDDLCEHLDLLMLECAKFHGIYDGHMKEMHSGENRYPIIELLLNEFRGLHNVK